MTWWIASFLKVSSEKKLAIAVWPASTVFKKEAIPEIQVSEEQAARDLDKAISFDDDYDEIEEESVERVKAESSESLYDDDEDVDDDDEWAKFDGF